MEINPEREHAEEIYYPSFLFKEMVVTMLIFILVVFILSMFSPAGLEDPAEPADNLYVPKPVWYFMALYQLLKYFPGRLEVIATSIIPAGSFAILLILPFIDRNPEQRLSKRPVAVTLMLLAVMGITLLTILGLAA